MRALWTVGGEHAELTVGRPGVVAGALDDLGSGKADVGEVIDQGPHDVVGDGVAGRTLAHSIIGFRLLVLDVLGIGYEQGHLGQAGTDFFASGFQYSHSSLSFGVDLTRIIYQKI